MEVIASVGSVEALDDFGPTALAALGRVLPFDMGSFNEVDPERGRAVFCAHPPDLLQRWAATVSAFPRWVHQNPIMRHHMRTGDGSARRMSDFVSRDELHALELYREVYGPMGIDYQVAVALPARSPLVIAIALNRTERDFTDGEVGLLDVLRPHLVQAHRNIRTLAALDGINGALEVVGRAAIVLNDGGVSAASDWARRVLAQHFGASAPGTLPEEIVAWVAEERRHSPTVGEPRLHHPLVSVLDDGQLIARLVRGSSTRPDVIVIDERAPEQAVPRLRQLGLSNREAQLMLLLTRGHNNAMIARSLHLSPTTVKKHLQNIYRKLGVSTRTAAVAVAFDALTALH